MEHAHTRLYTSVQSMIGESDLLYGGRVERGTGPTTVSGGVRRCLLFLVAVKRGVVH